jgi:hypothetical protein
MSCKISAGVNTLTRAIEFAWRRKVILIPAIALLFAGCFALQPPNANGPKSDKPAYPLLLAEDTARLEAALGQWERLAQTIQQPSVKEIRLHPYTATIESLPANSALYLPKVGTKPTMSEEEIREALRRFINDWQGLIGADPAQLSLVERADQPEGIKLARYEQHPFRFPLRGAYGALQIRFTADRRVVDLSSSCIPNAERLQPAIAAMDPQLTWEEAANRIISLTATYGTIASSQNTYQLSQANTPEVRELVVYSRPPSARGDLPAFHLAWEIAVSNAPFKLVYLDAVNGELIATS